MIWAKSAGMISNFSLVHAIVAKYTKPGRIGECGITATVIWADYILVVEGCEILGTPTASPKCTVNCIVIVSLFTPDTTQFYTHAERQ